MSEENSGGSGGLRNAIIGLISILITAITGIVAKNFMSDDTTPPPAATAPAPVVINLENNVKAGGSGGGSATPAPAPKKKDDWTKAEPKW